MRPRLLIALLLVAVLVVGGLLLRPALRADPVPPPTASPSASVVSDGHPKEHTGVRTYRLAASAVDNTYPSYDFPVRGKVTQPFNTRSCAILGNVATQLTVRIVAVNVGPGDVFRLRASACREVRAGNETGYSRLSGCVPGSVLPPLAAKPQTGCSVGIELTQPGTHGGRLRIIVRTTCTARAASPCSWLPASLEPTPADPVELTLDHSASFTALAP
jgi:hypothetical protein